VVVGQQVEQGMVLAVVGDEGAGPEDEKVEDVTS
jgi:hypothetical protein